MVEPCKLSSSFFAAGDEQQVNASAERLRFGLIFAGVIYLIIFVCLLCCLLLKCLEKLNESRHDKLANSSITSRRKAPHEEHEECPAADATSINLITCTPAGGPGVTRRSVFIRIADKMYELIAMVYTSKKSGSNEMAPSSESKLNFLAIDVIPSTEIRTVNEV